LHGDKGKQEKTRVTKRRLLPFGEAGQICTKRDRNPDVNPRTGKLSLISRTTDVPLTTTSRTSKQEAAEYYLPQAVQDKACDVERIQPEQIATANDKISQKPREQLFDSELCNGAISSQLSAGDHLL